MRVLYIICSLFFSLAPSLYGSTYFIQDLSTLSAEKTVPMALNNNGYVSGKIYHTSTDREDFVWSKESGLILTTEESKDQSIKINNENTTANICWTKTNYWVFDNYYYRQIRIHYPNGLEKKIEYPSKWVKEEISTWKTPKLWIEFECSILGFTDKEQLFISTHNKLDKKIAYACWDNGSYHYINTDISSPDYELSVIYSVNNQGVILGKKWIEIDHMTTPMLVLYDLKDKITIEIMKDLNLTHKFLNDEGKVILIKKLTEDKSIGFIWQEKNEILSFEDILPIAMNEKNQIIGKAVVNFKKTFFLRDNGVWINLNEILDLGYGDCMWSEIDSLHHINNQGQISGIGIHNGAKHAFILNPIP